MHGFCTGTCTITLTGWMHWLYTGTCSIALTTCVLTGVLMCHWIGLSVIDDTSDYVTPAK